MTTGRTGSGTGSRFRFLRVSLWAGLAIVVVGLIPVILLSRAITHARTYMRQADPAPVAATTPLP